MTELCIAVRSRVANVAVQPSTVEVAADPRVVQVLALREGKQGEQGERGPQGIQGKQGEQGVQGEAGVSLDIEGTVSTYADLPSDPKPGDAYVVAADGKLYFFDGTAWPDDGGGVPFRGPQGEQGIQGEQGKQGIQGVQGEQGDPGPSGVAGAWQMLGRFEPVGGTYAVATLVVPAGDWLAFRVTFIGTYTTLSLSRIVSFTINDEPSGIWEGNWAIQEKNDLVDASDTWSSSWAGAGFIETRTSRADRAPIGVLPTKTGHLHGELYITPGNGMVSYRADLAGDKPDDYTRRILANGYAAYADPITSIQIYGANMRGLLVLEGIPAS